MNETQFETVNQFVHCVSGIVNQICDAFTDPQDDFNPVLHVQAGSGEMFVVGLDGRLLDSGFSKNVLVHEIMVPMIEGFGGKMIATVMSAWTLSLKDMSPSEAAEAIAMAQRNGLGDHPNKAEIVSVNAMSAHDVTMVNASINRDGVNPPTLGPWETMSQGGVITGRMFEPLQAALRDSSGVPNPEFLNQLGRP